MKFVCVPPVFALRVCTCPDPHDTRSEGMKEGGGEGELMVALCLPSPRVTRVNFFVVFSLLNFFSSLFKVLITT